MPTLDDLRAQIRALDKSLIATLAQRQELCLKVGKLKFNQNVAVEDLKQEKIQFDHYRLWSSDCPWQPEFICSLFELIIKESKRIQSTLLG